jgi:fluoroacetyl-CoA thioesterase
VTRSDPAFATSSPSRWTTRKPFPRCTFATGYLVGLIEWTCIQAVNPHIDWPREQTVETRIELGHSAPTPSGCPVTVEVELAEVEGRRLQFRVSARDDVSVVSEGTHERFVIDAERFNAKLSGRRSGA